MAKKGGLNSVLAFLMWIVGILVSLAVGFAMTNGTLVVPSIPVVITQIAGWIVVIATVIGVIMAIIDKLS